MIAVALLAQDAGTLKASSDFPGGSAKVESIDAATLETSWNTPHGTIANYKRVGRELEQAIERYFCEDARR